MWDDYGVIRPGRMPFDVYENGQIVFTQNPVAFDAPIGTVVGTISVINATPTYKLSVGKNPYFAISGHNLISKAALVGGVDFVQIFAIKGFKRIAAVARIVVSGNAPPIPPAPPGEFFLGLNLSGMEDATGVPTQEEMAYWSNLGIKHFRIPLNWINLQPFAFGPLDTISHFLNTGLSYPACISQVLASAAATGTKVLLDLSNFGGGSSVNALLQTSQVGTGSGNPWFVANAGSSNPAITLNFASAPDGTTTATKLVYPAVTTTNMFSLLAEQLNTSVSTQMTWSLYLRGDVGGEVVYLSSVTASGPLAWAGRVRCVLTTSWQRFSFTGTTRAGGQYFIVGTDLRDPSQSSTPGGTVYAWGAQAEAGTIATDYVVIGKAQPGYRIGTLGVPLTALPNLWTTFSAFLRADPNYSAVYGYDLMNEWHNMDPNASFDASTPYSQNLIFHQNQDCITALRATGDNSLIVCEWDHYSGAWDAITNNVQLLFSGIVDPINNWMVHFHSYLDQDASGTHFAASEVFGQPSTSPSGITVTVNIGAQRVAAVAALAAQHGRPIGIGECGWSTDFPQLFPDAGAFNYTEWNLAGTNFLTFCRQNNIPLFFWASGPSFDSYGYDPVPKAAYNWLVKDFSSLGWQAPQVVSFTHFTGYSGPQPMAYWPSVPLGQTSAIVASPNQTISDFSIYYGGVISSEMTFTGHAKLIDGTDVGGTFSPIVLSPGLNGFALFSYTTPSTPYAGINLTFTNDKGLTDSPVAFGVSTLGDFFSTTIGAVAPNILFLRRMNNSYVGPAIRLQRVSDSAQMDFYFNVAGNLPRQAIQDWASSRTIQLVTIYDQSGNGNNATFNNANINLILVDTDGYPSVQVIGPVIATVTTPSIGAGLMTIYSEINPANGGYVATQDFFNGTFRFNKSFFSIDNNSGHPTLVTIGASDGSWSDIAGTYSDLYGTNNLNAYIAGSEVHQTTAPQFVNNSADNAFSLFNFAFADVHYTGSFRGMIIQYLEYSAAQLTTLHGLYQTYFTTPLPDTLSSFPPSIFGMVAPQVSMDQGAPALWKITASGGNNLTASIAVSGAAGTMSHLGPYAPSGSGPYTFGSMTSTEMTRALRNLLWLPSVTTPGTTTTFTVTITDVISSATATGSNTITNVAPAAMPSALTPVATPAALPHHYKGINLAGGNFDSPGPLYVLDPSYYTFFAGAGTGMDTLRWQFQINYLVSSVSERNTNVGAIGLYYRNLQAADISAMQSGAELCRQDGQYIDFCNMSFGGTLNPFPTGTQDDSQDSSPFIFWGIDIRVPISCLVDVWKRIYSLFQNYPNIILELDNEPSQSATICRSYTSAVSAAVRPIGAFGATLPIYTPSTPSVFSFDYTAWTGFTDPGPVYMNVHQYFDPSGGGFGPSANLCRNFNPAAYFDTFTSWCRINTFKAVVTEFAYGTDTSCTTSPPTPAVNTVASYFTTNNDVYIGWNWHWSGRIAPTTTYYLGPGGANVQLSDLTANLGNTF